MYGHGFPREKGRIVRVWRTRSVRILKRNRNRTENVLKGLHIRIDRKIGGYFKTFTFMLLGYLNAFICKSTGLELNPALRVSSISHPFLFHFYVGSRNWSWGHRGRTRVRKLAGVIYLATIYLFFCCMNKMLYRHGSDCLICHVWRIFPFSICL